MLKNIFKVVLLLTSAVACFEEDETSVCGDGMLGFNENEATCCLDSGCHLGVCDENSKACVQPAELICPSVTEQCSQVQKPYMCKEPMPPQYNCAVCGCPNDEQCYEAVCYKQETIDLQRENDDIPNDLPLNDYFTFMDWAVFSEAMTLETAVAEIDKLLSQDDRRAALIIGESHNSFDEQAVGLELIRAVMNKGWTGLEIGIEAHTSTINNEQVLIPLIDISPIADLEIPETDIEGNFSNDTYCKQAIANTRSLVNDQGLYLQYLGSGHTSFEPCYHPELYPRCVLPHAAECVKVTGRQAIVVILFDPEVWLWNTDRVLLWRCGNNYPNETAMTTALDEAISGFQEHLAFLIKETAFDLTATERSVNVRFVRSQYSEDVFIAFFPRPNRPAYLMQSFRALWNDTSWRAFLLEHDIQPKNCSIAWNLEPDVMLMTLYCGNNGYKLTADVDANNFTLISAIQTEP